MRNQFAPEKMNAYPISDLVNTLGENSISMIYPKGAKLQSEEQTAPKVSPYYHHGHKVKHLPKRRWGESRK
jgi:hypothetical protein